MIERFAEEIEESLPQVIKNPANAGFFYKKQ